MKRIQNSKDRPSAWIIREFKNKMLIMFPISDIDSSVRSLLGTLSQDSTKSILQIVRENINFILQ